MRTVTKTIEIYKYDDAPDNVKEKVKETLTGDGTLYEHNFQERVATLKAVAELLDGTLDYSISVVPDRGEFITIKPKDDELNFKALWDVMRDENGNDIDCPLTGMYYDYDFLNHITENFNTNGNLGEALNAYLKSIHDEWENMCGDEYLKEHCEANDYEFTNDGRIY